MTNHQPFDRVEIRRFRGLSELDLDGLGRFNVLLGANDVGKTSVLEALFLLTGFANPGLPLQLQRGRHLPFRKPEDLEALFHQLDSDRPIDLVAHSAGAVARCSLHISVPYAELTLDSDSPESPDSTTAGAARSATVGAGLGQSSSLTLPRRRLLRYDVTLHPHDGAPESLSALLRFDAQGVEVKHSAKPTDEVALSARYITPGVAADATAIGELIVRKNVAPLLEFLRVINPRVTDLAVSGDLVYLDIGLDRLVPLNLFGSAMVRAATILSHCIQGNERILLLDELENGLHHAAVRPLLETLLALSRDHDMQIFVTTHSEAVLQSLLDLLRDDGFSDHRSTTHCYTLQRDHEGHVRPYRYEYAQFEHCVRHGIEIR